MSPVNLAIFIAIYYVLDIECRPGAKYFVNLENLTDCGKPVPPYAKERIFISVFYIRRQKKTTLIGGHHTVLEDVPFRNFSVATYSVDRSGNENLLQVIENLSCHSWLSKAYLTISKIRYNNNDCRVKKGAYEFHNMDVNAVQHSYPNYHNGKKGTILYRMHLVYNRTTVFCQEMSINVN